MRPSFLFLLTLIGMAVASHDICYYIDHHSTGLDRVVAMLRDSDGILFDGEDVFANTTKMFIFRPRRVTIYINRNAGFSVNWDGIDWGGFSFQKEISTLHTKLKYGCYDTSNNGYCKYQEEHWKGCQDIMTGPNAPLNSRRAPRRWVQ